MHRDKLDHAKQMSLVEKYGYSDIAAALRERGGLPGGVEDIDDFSADPRRAPNNFGHSSAGTPAAALFPSDRNSADSGAAKLLTKPVNFDYNSGARCALRRVYGAAHRRSRQIYRQR